MLRYCLTFILLSSNCFANADLWIHLFSESLYSTLILNPLFSNDSIILRTIASENKNTYRPKLIAHRGVLYPEKIENTTDAIIEAMSNSKVDGIEIDVCITLDNQIILWHDNNPFDLLGNVRRFGMEGRKIIPAILDSSIIERKSVNLMTYEEVKKSLGYMDTANFNKMEMFQDFTKIEVEIPLFKNLISEPFFQLAYPNGKGKTIFLDTKLPADLAYTKKFALSLVKVLKSVANANSIQKHLVILQENPTKLKTIKEILIKNSVDVNYAVDYEITTHDKKEIVGIFSARDNCSMENNYTSLGKPVPLFGDGAYSLFLKLNNRDREFIEKKCPHMKSVIWTINSFNDFEDILNARPDFVMTDHPIAFSTYLDKCYKNPNSICKK